MPRYSLLACCSVLLLLGLQMLTLLRTYVYSCDDGDDDCIVIFFLSLCPSLSLCSSCIRSLPFSLTRSLSEWVYFISRFTHSFLSFYVLFHICATKNMRKYLYICVCMPLDRHKSIECVLGIHKIQVLLKYILRTCTYIYIYRIFVYAVLWGIDTLNCTHTHTTECVMCCVYIKYRCICADILDS